MYNNIKSLFGRLGLKDRESLIYLACLKYHEGLFTHEIVHETRLQRSAVDLIVKRLLQRGFLNKTKSGRRMRFIAQPPEAILFRQKQLVEDLEHVVPMLTNLGGEKKYMEILYFEGAQGFRQVHDDALRQIKSATGIKKDMLSFSSGVDSMRLYPDMQKGFIEKRIRYGSWYKAIAPQSSTKVREWLNDPKSLRRVKYLPDDDYPFRIDIQMYGDTTMLYSTVPPVGGVTIRNERICDSMRALFNLVWKLLPEEGR